MVHTRNQYQQDQRLMERIERQAQTIATLQENQTTMSERIERQGETIATLQENQTTMSERIERQGQTITTQINRLARRDTRIRQLERSQYRCPICMVEHPLQGRVPLVAEQACGHVFCQLCINRMAVMGRMRCQHCQQPSTGRIRLFF